MEPRGTLYVRIRHTDPHELFRRRPAAPRLSLPPLFGAELDAVVAREVRPPHMPPVPVIVRRCVEEIERRGLDIIGKELKMLLSVCCAIPCAHKFDSR